MNSERIILPFINALGGVRAVAEALSQKERTVRGWTQREAIPYPFHPRVLKMAKDKDVTPPKAIADYAKQFATEIEGAPV